MIRHDTLRVENNMSRSDPINVRAIESMRINRAGGAALAEELNVSVRPPTPRRDENRMDHCPDEADALAMTFAATRPQIIGVVRAMKSRKFRLCPSCKNVFGAGKLRVQEYGPHWSAKGKALRKCPECYYTGETWQFTVVLDNTRRKSGPPADLTSSNTATSDKEEAEAV